MRLTLRQEWKPRLLSSFLGFMDIKTGVIIALLFALLNKVTGVYGLIAVFTGGSLAQLSMYLYSALALVAFGWGLKVVTNEDPKGTLYFAHIFLADHLLNTIWTVFFGVAWWVYNPHDGRRVANSDAQKEMMGSVGDHHLSDEERIAAAQTIWHKEKGFAAAILITGWIVKIYFAVLIYSYAVHLRKGSYRGLPLTNPPQTASLPLYNSRRNHPYAAAPALSDDELDGGGGDDFYRMPMSATSVSSFADALSSAQSQRTRKARAETKAQVLKLAQDEPIDEVLWDEDEERNAEGVGGTGVSSKRESPESSDADGENAGVQRRSSVR